MAALLDLLAQAGWETTPLLLLAGYITAAAAERAAALRREPRDPLPVLQAFHRGLGEGGVPGLIADSERFGAQTAYVVRAVCDAPSGRRQAAAAAVAEAERRLGSGLLWLYLAAEMCPLVGALGCVLRLTGHSRPGAGATDVAMALCVAGLLVAAWGWLAGFALERLLRGRRRVLEQTATELCEMLAARGDRP